MSSADADDRKAALAELVHCGIHGEEAVDAAQRLAAVDSDLVVRAHAASTLWSLTRHADAPVAALTGLLVSEDETVLQVASYLLGSIGPSAADAIPDLRQLCDRSSGATNRASRTAEVRSA